MENEPVIKLELVDGQEIEARRDNTALYTHLGHFAIYDHVFILLDDEKNTGSFIFNQNTAYKALVDALTEYRYPMHLNLPEASEGDIKAWERMVSLEAADDLNNGIPDEWLK